MNHRSEGDPGNRAVLIERLRSFARSARVDTDPTCDAGPPRVPGVTVPILRGGDVLLDVLNAESSMGIRSVTTASSRQVVAGTDGLLVVLDIRGVGDLHHVTGQVIGGALVVCIQAVSEDVETGLSIADEHGEFELADLPSGRTDLIVADGITELMIRLELG